MPHVRAARTCWRRPAQRAPCPGLRQPISCSRSSSSAFRVGPSGPAGAARGPGRPLSHPAAPAALPALHFLMALAGLIGAARFREGTASTAPGAGFRNRNLLAYSKSQVSGTGRAEGCHAVSPCLERMACS